MQAAGGAEWAEWAAGGMGACSGLLLLHCSSNVVKSSRSQLNLVSKITQIKPISNLVVKI